MSTGVIDGYLGNKVRVKVSVKLSYNKIIVGEMYSMKSESAQLSRNLRVNNQ